MFAHTAGEGGVLVPGISAPSSVTCVRSLGRRGISVVVGSDSPDTPAAHSRYCEAFVHLPDPTEGLDAYAESLLAVAKRSDIRTIVPVREADIYALSRRKESFSDVIATPWPDFATLRRVQDRVELFSIADTAGVATPETALATEWDDWDRETILKARYTVTAPAYLGPGAEQNTIESTAYREPGPPPDTTALREDWGHVPLVQEYVDDSDEYAFFALYDDGDLVETFQHRQRRGYKYCGGPSAYRESVAIPELDAAGRTLLDALDWHGLAMVEFLRDPETGEFKLMEINPRFWSSLPFTVRAGSDFPNAYWRLATGDPPRTPSDYQVGMGGHLLRGELCHLHSVATEEYPLVEKPSLASQVRDVVASLLENPHFDYPALDDPKPFVQDILQVFCSGDDTAQAPEPSAETDCATSFDTRNSPAATETPTD